MTKENGLVRPKILNLIIDIIKIKPESLVIKEKIIETKENKEANENKFSSNYSLCDTKPTAEKEKKKEGKPQNTNTEIFTNSSSLQAKTMSKKNSKIQKLNSKGNCDSMMEFIQRNPNNKSCMTETELPANHASQEKVAVVMDAIKQIEIPQAEGNEGVIAEVELHKMESKKSQILLVEDGEKKHADEMKSENENSEDDEDYFEKIRQLREEREKKNNNQCFSMIDNQNGLEKNKKHRLTENTLMRLYLFETQIYCDFQVYYGECIKDLKLKVLGLIFGDGEEKYKSFSSKLKHGNVPDAYEIRMADEDEDVNPNFDFPPFEDKLNLLSSKWQTVCFLEKSKYVPSETPNIILGVNPNNDKIVIRIHNKTDTNGSTFTTVIEESKDKTLLYLLERLEKRKFLHCHKNFDYYMICDHTNEDLRSKKEMEMEDEFNLEMQLKYLSTFELDVSFNLKSRFISKNTQMLQNQNQFLPLNLLLGPN